MTKRVLDRRPQRFLSVALATALAAVLVFGFATSGGAAPGGNGKGEPKPTPTPSATLAPREPTTLVVDPPMNVSWCGLSAGSQGCVTTTTMSASLLTATGRPIEGRIVELSGSNGTFCNGTTLSTGIAVCSDTKTFPGPGLALFVRGRFAGDSTYEPSSGDFLWR